MTSTLTFCTDKDTTIDTLEAVLATARRGGLQLARLQMHARGAHDQVVLELIARDSDLLDLFVHRVRNLFGVYSIERDGG
jgi:acetolactate synthase regulatory subunit